MKKLLLLSLAFIFAAFILTGISALIFAFTFVKPTADSISRKLIGSFSKTVAIPPGIPRPAMSLDEVSYYWEMETPEKEVTAVKFHFDPAFSKNQDKIEAVLEMPPGSDPSIFEKVLSAIIVDKQTLESANPQKANFSANKDAGYSEFKIEIDPQKSKPVRFIWFFDKANLSDEIKNSYKRLNNYPEFLIRTLYNLPSIIMGLFGA